MEKLVTGTPGGLIPGRDDCRLLHNYAFWNERGIGWAKPKASGMRTHKPFVALRQVITAWQGTRPPRLIPTRYWLVSQLASSWPSLK